MDDLKNASHRVSIKIICKTKEKILLMKRIDKDIFNLVGGWVDRWESLQAALKREFEEETWIQRNPSFSPKLFHTEIKQFPVWGQFDAVVNVFFIIEFEDSFTIKLEKGVYEKYWRFTKQQLNTIKTSEHTNKRLLLSIL